MNTSLPPSDLNPMPHTPIGPSDEELEIAISRYRAAFETGEMSDFDIGSLDRLGHSVVVAGLRSPDGFTNDGFGYGASAREALVGALGEMSETFHVHQTLKRAPACEAMSRNAMVKRFGEESVIDPLTLCLPAGSDWTPDTPLRWVVVNSWPEGAQAWVPRECIATSPFSYSTLSVEIVASGNGESMCLFRPITCGLGAGTSLEMALSHGVLELLQRDGNCTRFRAMDRGIDLKLDRIDDPGIKRLLASLSENGLRVRAKLASTEFDLVNLYVIAEPEDDTITEDFVLKATACGEAVHANRERALRKALLEYISARIRKTFMHGPLGPIESLAPATYIDQVMACVDPLSEEPRALEEMSGWLDLSAEQLRESLASTVFSNQETRNFSSLPSSTDESVRNPQDRMNDLASRLDRQSLPIYYFDASPEGDDKPQVIKAIVPGLEGETLSYARIGERGVKRLLKEHPELVSVGEPRDDNECRVRLTDEAEARLGGPAWFSTQRANSIVGALYPLYREPGSHSVQKQREAEPEKMEV